MIVTLIADTRERERLFIEDSAHRQILRLTDDYCSYNVFDTIEKADGFVDENDALDIAIIDISRPEGCELCEKIRKKYSNTFILLVAAGETDPRDYVIPSVAPDLLILRPARAEEVEKAMKRAFDWFYYNIYSSTGGAGYVFKGKEGRMMIEYPNIAYFESRDKRIILCTDNEEYCFYETIDNLANTLPESFVRCHRSFIVNSSRIKNMRLSDNCIVLDNGFMVPLSRSYKTAIKDRFG